MEEADDETASPDGIKQMEVITEFKLIPNNSEVIKYSEAEKRPQILAALAGFWLLFLSSISKSCNFI